MLFEIDVSGSDIFEKDYTIMVAEKNAKILLGHKITEKTRKTIRAKQGQGHYRYSQSKKGKASLKVRVYCTIIYFIFRELKRKHNIENISMEICHDFPGRETEIREMLKQLLGKNKTAKSLNLKIERISFVELPADSPADNYAFLLKRDKLNKLKNLECRIKTEEIEEFLKK